MLQRANYLKEHQKEDIHVLVSNTTVMVAVNGKSVRDITAQNVSSTWHWWQKVAGSSTSANSIIIVLGIEESVDQHQR